MAVFSALSNGVRGPAQELNNRDTGCPEYGMHGVSNDRNRVFELLSTVGGGAFQQNERATHTN